MVGNGDRWLSQTQRHNFVDYESRVKPMVSGEERYEYDFYAMHNIAVKYGCMLVSRHPRKEPDRRLATPYLGAISIVRAVLRG